MAMKHNLLTSAAVWPVSFGIVAGALGLAAAAAYAPCRVRCGPTRPAAQNASTEALNPVAAKRPANPTAAIRLAASCNPCAAAACSPCNPCAGANPCNPCDPCAPGAAAEATGCVVPSLRQAAACNPCAASKPAACNPCNPCAVTAACSPCNPCAANPCNPCAAANPCNPCAANPCSPCAAAGEPPTVADDEMQALYDCLKPLMLEAYGPGDHAASGEWADWERFSTKAYVSGTHGGRFVQNYANDVGEEDYGKFEDVDEMPGGSILAKPSFTVGAGGEAALGPLFLMEKMSDGWNSDTADWRYAMINADGSTFGATGGQNSDGMRFCHECHTAGQDTDYLLFLPEEFRRQ
jgi:hypothetical protein